MQRVRRITFGTCIAAVGVYFTACLCGHCQPEGNSKKTEIPVRKTLPQGYGLAAKYPGDKGIENDPAVIFVEDFEEATLNELFQRWESVRAREILSFSDEVPAGSSGKQSLLMTHVGGKGTGGHLYRRLLPGYDKIFVRFYVKFHPDCFPIHHFFHVGGYYPPTRWPQGGAGERPRGDERFTIGVEPFGKAWVWDYYTYWMEMRGSPPAGKTWGNSFIRDPRLKVQRGQWTCVELMVKLNKPVTERNGELALWINGKLVSHLGEGFPRGAWVYDKFIPKNVWPINKLIRYAPGKGVKGVRWNEQKRRGETFVVPDEGAPFEGFRWRKDERLKINFLWLLLYITDAPEGYVSRVWFDQIVVAHGYIGPIKPKRNQR